MHEKRGAIDSCDDAPHQEGERVWWELRAESRLPHVPVGLLSWRLANVITSHADQGTVHAHSLDAFLVHWGHAAHVVLALGDPAVGRAHVVVPIRV